MEIAGDVFRALILVDGNVHVPNLKILRVKDVPCRGAPALSGLLQKAGALHAMVLSCSGGSNLLETLSLSLEMTWFHNRRFIPVAANSHIRNLLKIKEGLDVTFLLDTKDCLVEGNARTRLFGSLCSWMVSILQPSDTWRCIWSTRKCILKFEPRVRTDIFFDREKMNLPAGTGPTIFLDISTFI